GRSPTSTGFLGNREHPELGRSRIPANERSHLFCDHETATDSHPVHRGSAAVFQFGCDLRVCTPVRHPMPRYLRSGGTCASPSGELDGCRSGHHPYRTRLHKLLSWSKGFRNWPETRPGVLRQLVILQRADIEQKL